VLEVGDIARWEMSYATEQMLLEIELDIRVLLDYFENLYTG
jgi:hypothetical protein